jgi:hypothetical protein
MAKDAQIDFMGIEISIVMKLHDKGMLGEARYEKVMKTQGRMFYSYGVIEWIY